MERIFRFEKLIIWQIAIEITDELFDIADMLEERKLFRFAEQLRGAGMSMTNNIAEGSGSDLNTEFRQFLRYNRRSCFECANIFILLSRRKLIDDETKIRLHTRLDELSRKTTNFMKSLGKL